MSETLVFLVEPDARQVPRLAAALQAGDRVVLTASTGAEALARLRRDAPDLVVLDTGVGDQDGFALCARLRLAALEGDLPIIALTVRPGGEETARRAGADAVLRHPIEAQDLSALVRSQLDRRTRRAGGPRAHLATLPALGRLDPRPATGRGPTSGGVFEPADLPRFLLARLEERFTGLVEIEAGDRQARLSFSAGHPTGVGLRSPETGIGRLLVEGGQLTDDQVEQVAQAARRQGVPLGRLLVSHELVDPVSLDCCLQFQTLRRLAALLRFPRGSWRLGDRLASPGAGFPTHAAAALWHLADVRVPVPPLSAEEEERFVVAGAPLASIWHLFDPKGRAAGLRLVLLGGGRPADARELAGERVLPLLALLRHTGVIALSEDPPDAARRAAVLARSDIEPFRERLEATWAIASGADAYTVLGIPGGATPAQAEQAALELLDRYRPETLPPGLSALERARATELHRQVLAAKRALSHPRRRAAHDYLMRAVDSGGQLGGQALDHAIFHAEHARLLYRRGEHLAAAAMLAVAVQLEGETADLLCMLGQARHRAAPDDPAAGETELRRALRLDPQHALANLFLGRLLFARGEADLAHPFLRRARRLAPDLPAAREALDRIGGAAVSPARPPPAPDRGAEGAIGSRAEDLQG